MNSEINSPSSDEPAVETICELLRDDRRRLAVSALSERESPTALVDLASDVVARETGSEPTEVSPERVEAVAASLHHLHLPKLADAGAVTYDTERKSVRAERIDALDRHLPTPEN